MRIERLEVIGFGCLRRHTLRLKPQRANLILARNEAGKSTALAAIEVALYGWPSARTQEGRAMRQQYRPWQGGASRVTLELHDGLHGYRIECELLDAAGEAADRMTVRRDQQDVTDLMTGEAATPGAWLLRLTRDDFRRSVLVRQGELELVARHTDSLVEHLDAVVTSTAAGVSASTAQECLAAALEDYRGLAGLEHWSQSHLERAAQWSRVETKLRERIDAYEREGRELEQRRDGLAHDIERLEHQDARLATLRQARACLRVLERAVQRRNLQRQLDDDDSLAAQLDETQQRIDALDDVGEFPAERATELTRLLERESQLRQQLSAAAAPRERATREIQELEDRKAQLAHVATLGAPVDELRSQLTLFRQALADRQAAEQQRTAALQELEDAGHPLPRLHESRACYQALTFDERQTIRDVDRRRLGLEQRRRESDQARRDGRQQIDEIKRLRAAQRRRGLVLVGGGVIGGALVCTLLGWVWGAGAATLVLSAGLVLIVPGVYGGWLMLGARQLDAYRHDQLQDQIQQAQHVEEELNDEQRRLRLRLDELAGRQGLTADALVDAVQFYLAHHDQLEAHERAEARCEDAQAEVAAHQRRWAQWLRISGQEQAVEDVCAESAAALVEQVGTLEDIAGKLNDLHQRQEQASQAAAGLRADLRRLHESIAASFKPAGVELALPHGSDELVSREELVVARREFERRAARFEQRRQLVTQRDGLRERRLAAGERSELESRCAKLDAEPRAADAATPPPDEALVWLQDQLADDEQCALAGRSPDTLLAEDMASASEHVDREIEHAQAARGNTWQDARGFLSEYTRWMQRSERELRQLRAELRRGQEFAEALKVARETLAAVQANSYERWSGLLASKLGPLLDEFLGEYRLESIAVDLSPVLVHVLTGQRLDMAGIELHLSRGAKDRLYLALRLALAQVLGEERGVHLPLLLDDPLANWDDEALAGGLRRLGGLGRTGGSLIIFTCQRSRCEQVAKTLARSKSALALHEFP